MATKHYVLTKDMIDSAMSETSENPVQNKVIKAAVDAKLDKTYSAEEKGKVPRVGSDGVLVLSALPEGSQSDWNQESTEEADYIKNRPFKKVGEGLTVDSEGHLNVDTQLHFELFDSLPTASETYKQTIALIKKETAETGDYYNEYACVEASGSWAWELIGSMKGSVEQTEKSITINGVEIHTASDTQIGLMSAVDHADMQVKSNLITEMGLASDENYPSAKLVKENLNLKQDLANLVTTISPVASASDDKYPSEKAVATEAAKKVAFATGSTSTAFVIGKDETGYYIEE